MEGAQVVEPTLLDIGGLALHLILGQPLKHPDEARQAGLHLLLGLNILLDVGVNDLGVIVQRAGSRGRHEKIGHRNPLISHRGVDTFAVVARKMIVRMTNGGHGAARSNQVSHTVHEMVMLFYNPAMLVAPV